MSYVEGHLVGLASIAGAITVEPRFAEADLFSSEGVIWARDATTQKVGFLSSTGEWSILPIFDGAGGFENGLAPVQIDGHWQYIDRTGAIALGGKKFNVAHGFSDGNAVVGKHTAITGMFGPVLDGGASYNYYIIDQQGREAPLESTPFQWYESRAGLAPTLVDGVAQYKVGASELRIRGVEDARCMIGGVAAVRYLSGWTAVREDGVEIMPREFRAVFVSNHGVIVGIRPDGSRLVVNRSGAIVSIRRTPIDK